MFNGFLFVVRYGGMFDRIAPIDASEVTIGRADHCNLRLVHDCVSRAHARIVRAPCGYAIRDLGSRNRTYVNERCLDDCHLLQEGDVVRIAPFSLRVFLDPEAAQTDAAMNDESTKAVPIHAVPSSSVVIDLREEMKRQLPPTLHSVYDALMDGQCEKDIVQFHGLNKSAVHYNVRRIYEILEVHSHTELLGKLTQSRH